MSIARCVVLGTGFVYGVMGSSAWASAFPQENSAVRASFISAEDLDRQCSHGFSDEEDLPAIDGGGGDPRAAVVGVECAPILLSQNFSDIVTTGSTCGLIDSQNNFCFSDAGAYARTFNLAAIEATAGKTFAVTCVDFGVRANITLNNPHPTCGTGGPGGDHTVSINIYRDTNGGAPFNHETDLELLGSQGVVVPFGTSFATMRATFDPPIRVPPDTQMVVELFTPTRIPAFGGDGGFFVVGFNANGETATGYLRTPNCGAPNFVPISSVLPFQLVLTAQGYISEMDFVDPDPELLVEAPRGSEPPAFFTDNLVTLLEKGRLVEGAAADGMTHLLIRVRVDGPGEVMLDLQDASGFGEDIGRLHPLGGGPGTTSLTVPVEFFAPHPGETANVAYALYSAPKDFATSPASPAAAEAARGVTVTAHFTPTGGSSELVESRALSIVRPPVALIHGLHDEGSSWQWSLKDDPRFTVHVANYKEFHGDHFLDNRWVARIAVIRALNLLRAKGYAGTRADVFGHSMGGVLSRLYMTDVLEVDGVRHAMDYKRIENYYQGDLHKLMTVNTPHYGSPVSELLVLPNGQLTKAGRVAQWYSERCVECGAVFDLRADSAMIHAINSVFVPLPVHIFEGDGEFITHDHPYTKEKATIAALCGMSLQVLMSGDSDAVVPMVSQRAGLPPAARSPHPGAEGLHWPTIAEFPTGLASTDAARMLNTSVDDPAFAGGFPIFSGQLPGAPECNIGNIWINSMTASGVPGMVITSPAPGVVYTEGEMVTVTAVPVGGFEPESVYIYMLLEGRMDEEVVEVNASPFEADFTLPGDHVGEVHFSAVGIDAERDVALSDNVFGATESAAVLTGITPLNSSIELTAYSPSAVIEAIGTYSDGIARTLRSSAGSNYASADPNVATVDSTGEVTAMGLGSTMVTVSKNGVSAAVTVAVISIPFDFDSNGSIGLTDALALAGCMSGPQNVASPIEETPAACRDFFDTDGDDDIDLRDWQGFANDFGQ